MTKDEITKLENWIEESDGPEETLPGEYDGGRKAVRKTIRFKPEIELFCHDSPAYRLDLRGALANYLRRVAAYLEA